MIVKPVVLAIVLLVAAAAPARAEALFYLQPAGTGAYTVEGRELGGISGIDIAVGYHRPTAVAPLVVKGIAAEGGMLAVNGTAPGLVRIGILNDAPLGAGGTIAALVFPAGKAGRGVPGTIHAAAIDGQGHPVPARAQLAPPVRLAAVPPPPQLVRPQAQPPSRAQDESSAGAPGNSPSPAIVIRGGASGSRSSAGSASGAGSGGSRPAAAPMNRLVVRKSVLELFRDYSGARTPVAMTGLFGRAGQEYRQDPPAALSDGKTTVTLHIPASPNGPPPTFALQETTLARLHAAPGEWLLVLLPEEGTTDATVTVMGNAGMVEIPLVVAPPVPALLDGPLPTEDDFRRFLADSGTDPPRYDLDGDGVHDYYDDYLYTANYLVMRSRSAGENGPSR